MFELGNEMLISLQAAPERAWWVDVIPFALIGLIMYVFLIRPENQKRAEHDALLSSLVKGNQIVTASGLHGRIVEVAETWVLLEVSERVRVTIDKSAVARRLDAGKS